MGEESEDLDAPAQGFGLFEGRDPAKSAGLEAKYWAGRNLDGGDRVLVRAGAGV